MIRAQSLVTNNDIDWQHDQHSLWIDVERPTEQELQALFKVLKFNRLALEDALTQGEWSRFEAYPEHVFLVFRTLDQPDACTEDTERVSLFWYPETETLVTVRLETVEYLDRIWTHLKPLEHGSEELVIHELLAQGASTFFQFTDALEERSEQMEEEMFTTRRPRQLASQVFEYKRLIMTVRRLVSNARDAVAAFARHALIVTDSPVKDSGNERLDPHAHAIATTFRDVVDTLGQAHVTLESMREVMSNVLEINLNVQGQHMNEVMKTLTVISSVFLPLTFMAGIWGMNFEHMPELSWLVGYPLALGSMAVVALLMVWWFRKRGWF